MSLSFFYQRSKEIILTTLSHIDRLFRRKENVDASSVDAFRQTFKKMFAVFEICLHSRPLL
jgi:hypothetical protein